MEKFTNFIVVCKACVPTSSQMQSIRARQNKALFEFETIPVKSCRKHTTSEYIIFWKTILTYSIRQSCICVDIRHRKDTVHHSQWVIYELSTVYIIDHSSKCIGLWFARQFKNTKDICSDIYTTMNKVLSFPQLSVYLSLCKITI